MRDALRALVGLLLLLPGLLGSAPTEGVVGLRTSPDAELLVYPRTDPRRIDLMIRKNRVPLGAQVDGLSAQHLDEIDAVSIGGGTWFVTLHVRQPDVVVTTEAEPGRVLLRLTRGKPELRQLSPEPPRLEALLRDPGPRRPASPPHLALMPLRGDASTLRLTSLQVLLELPPWRDAPVRLADTYGWPAIEGYRQRLSLASDPDVQAAARYRLGMEYLGIGWHREAAYYFESVLAGKGRFHGPAVALAAARAHLTLGRADRTRQLCRWADEQDAPPIAVMVCLGTASLHDGTPGPTTVARTLLSATAGQPQHRLLAAQLLMSDHRYPEAREILEPLAYGWDDVWVRATLGDARYFTGDVEGAKRAWAQASSKTHLLRERLVLRLKMAEMLEDGFSEWATRIPELLAITDRDGPEAAEAHYLIAQIAGTYGNPELAAEHLNRLWDRFPEIAERSDVPERLVAVCGERLDMLSREGRHADEVAFFTVCWRPELDWLSSDPELLQRTAARLVQLGLRPEGLSLQLRAMGVFTRLGQDDPDALAALTELYVETDRPREALQTLEYAEAVAEGRLPAAKFLVAEARARWADGDVQGALRAWTLAEGEGVNGARRAQGLIHASLRDCRKAEALLRDAGDDEARLARARCLARLGRDAEAAAILPVQGDDPLVLEDAAWIGNLLTVRGTPWPAPAPEPEPDDGADGTEAAPAAAAVDDAEPAHPIWAALLQEEQTAAAFQEKLDARRQR